MIQTVLIIALLIFAVGNAVLIWFFFKQSGKGQEIKEDKGLSLLLQQMNDLNRTVDQQINQLNKTVDQKIGDNTRQTTDSIKTQLGESKNIQNLIKEITRELTEVKEGNKRVENFTEQLRSLQDILKNPKQRGILGEYYLETLLKNVLPVGSFKMQYAFNDGTIVDAAVFVKDKIIPVDSKFSLENYNKLAEEKNEQERTRLEKLFVNDLKQRIQETSKYIQPSQGTMDFAFMFIPHEAIYYDLLISKIGALKDEDTENLIQRAASKYHVIIVSPTSFLAYLQTVLQGLNALHIEEQAIKIIKNVGDLSKHIKDYEEYHKKLGNSLGTVVNQYNESGKKFKMIDKDVLKITGESAGIEVLALDKPDTED